MESTPLTTNMEFSLIGQTTSFSESQIQRYLHRQAHSLYSRLRSIERDTYQLLQTIQTFPSTVSYHIYPNLRAGLWYLPTSLKTTNNTSIKGAVHFKSADGHDNELRVSLLRPNLIILDNILREQDDFVDGVVIVDVTRRGKKWPDSLSRSVPMWCGVINWLCLNWDEKVEDRIEKVVHGVGRDIEDVRLDQRVVERMIRVVERDVKVWKKLKVDWSGFEMRKELRPLFLSAGRDVTGEKWIDREDGWYIPVVCVTASVAIGGDGEEGRRFCEGRVDEEIVMGVKFGPCEGFNYVQGAGDDEEVWAMGLTPAIFWEHREWILGGGQTECEHRVKSLVSGPRTMSRTSMSETMAGKIWRVTDLQASNSRLWLSTQGFKATVEGELPQMRPATVIALGYREESRNSVAPKDATRNTAVSCPVGPEKKQPCSEAATEVFYFPCLNLHNKLDHKWGLTRNLTSILKQIRMSLKGTRHVILTDDAKPRCDWAAGVAVAWFAWCELQNSADTGMLDKDILRQTGFRILKQCPDVSLGRNTMKQVNRYFCSAGPYSVAASIDHGDTRSRN